MVMQDGTPAVDQSRILDDWVRYRWQCNLLLFLLLDDVMDAFGSIVHEIVCSVLLAAGVHPVHYHLIIFVVVH